MTGPIFDTHAHYSARAFDADRFALLDSLPRKGRGRRVRAGHPLRGRPPGAGTGPPLPLGGGGHWHPPGKPAACRPTCGEDGPAPTVSVYGGDWAAEMRALALYYEDPKVVAVGECGLDYHCPCPRTPSWPCLKPRSVWRWNWTSPLSCTTGRPMRMSMPC